MESQLDKAFKKLPSISPEQGLEHAIVMRIAETENMRERNRKTLWSVVGVGSFVSTIALAINMLTYLSHSGFFQYVSLVASEQGSILSFSKTLALALLESIPIVGSALLLTVLALLIWSVSSLRNTSKMTLAIS